ncbi:MAG TPA: bifunctional diaminohydroxyphosphoribosylaminopyrimidine deaminase/5-amino-6-(5-phosphoribosylamino)uracil reductase RibD [Acidimicrobiales bacterium]|nr:bifunctional diaminohydroxyphosphoribosylaminopyrimidine deaminase/5-amino-6-(5-phosphoribosylamino)uracil reductase RibD [Acidimicrobiales bacterium]
MNEFQAMERAVELAWEARRISPPNPWVGCVVLAPDGTVLGEGATAAPGGPHAEISALDSAGNRSRGSTLVSTLEPCSHYGRTPPCTDAIVSAGVARVVTAIEDPDVQVSGKGIAALTEAGLSVEVGCASGLVADQLRPYLRHRQAGLPLVVLKLALTFDGRIAAPDGSSRWITGPEARADVHQLRARSDAVLVGAGTVRADDPELTVREADGPDPIRVVLGDSDPVSRVEPAVHVSGPEVEILQKLANQGVLQLLIEGGADVAGRFHRAGLVDRYVLYMAPALMGGDDAVPMLRGPGAATLADAWRGRVVDVTRLGDDLRVTLEPKESS